MPDTDGDLPSALSDKVHEQTESRPTGRFVPLSTLWWNLLCAAIIAPLAFVLFTLALVWDQWLWMAIIALPIGIGAAVWAVWCLMMLQRYYLDQRTAMQPEPV